MPVLICASTTPTMDSRYQSPRFTAAHEAAHGILDRGLSTFYIDMRFQALSKDLISARRAAEMMLVDDFELAEIATLFGRRVRSE